MTTGATGQLGLALPVQGELSGTWGDTVNNGITQYTNIAIAGTLTLTGDGAVTLANTTGDASASNITSTLAGAGTVTAQFAIVRVSGTTTTKVVTGPSYSKTYVVDNASSYAVTFKASGQTGVSVAAAEKVTVVFNGTDYIKLAGTIANAAGSNTQIQFNNGGLFGASANLTWDGTTLSSTQVNITGQGTLRLQDTTGGEYVGLRSPSALGASYTLTFPADDGTSGQALITDGSGVLSWSTAASGDVYGPGSSTDNAVARFDSTTGKLLQNSVVLIGDTGAVTGVTDLTASGSVTLSGGTANGVTYLNGSKVLTSGSALTYDGTTFGVVGRLYNGSASTFNTSTWAMSLGNGGVSANYFKGATTYFQNDSGTQIAQLDSTGLGIGTNAPTQKLTVAGAINLSTDATNPNSGVALWSQAGIGATLSGFNITFNTGSNGAQSERMRVSSAGDVGIGTSSPSVKLEVAGAAKLTGTNLAIVPSTATSSAYVVNTNTGGNFFVGIDNSTGASFGAGNYGRVLYSSAAYPMAFFTNDLERMRITSGGLVGIGATSPSYLLDVHKTSDGVISRFRRIGATINPALMISANETGNTVGFSTDYAGATSPAMTFTTATVERMRVSSAGNVGIGVTAPLARLSVQYADSTPSSSGNMTSGAVFAYDPGGVALNVGSSSSSYTYFNAAYANNAGVPAEWRFYQGGNQSLTLNTSAQLMLGTTTAQASFTIGTGGTQSTNAIIAGPTSGTAAVGDKIVIGFQLRNTSGGGTGNQYASAIAGVQDKAASNGGALGFYTQAAAGDGTPERMRITSAGLVGIATTSPAAPLDIGGNPTYENRLIWSRGNNDADFKAVLSSGDAGTTATVGSIGVTYGGYKDFSSIQFYRNSSTGQILFFTGGLTGDGTEKARINSSGNLLVGTTSQSGKLAVSGDATSVPLVTFYSSTAGDVGQPGLLIGKQDNNTTTSQIILRATILSTGAGAGQINMNGANSLAFGTYSDERLKENIVDLPPQLASILSLRPVEFDYIQSEGGGHQTGFIAQEMQQVYSDAVGEREDGMLTVSGWDKTTARLVKAIQEQQTIIESLKARLDAANL